MDNNQQAVALAYVRVIADVVDAHGGNGAALLREAGIRQSPGSDPFAEWVSLAQYERLLRQAIDMTGRPGLGLLIGQGLKFGSHGTFAYAALSFPTAWEAMKVGRKFSKLCNRIVDIEMQEGRSHNLIRLDTPYFTGALYSTVIEIAVGSFCEIFNLKFDRGVEAIEIDLRYGRPPYGDLYDALLQPAVRFEAEANEIRIPKHLADKRLAMADATVAERFERECDERLADLHKDIDTVDRVRQALFLSKGGFPKLDELAARLHMSPRTLRRRLRERGTSFRELLEAVRLDIARRYLTTTTRSIGEIAHMLGYEDRNSFSHAFKVLTGMPPREYRKRSGP